MELSDLITSKHPVCVWRALGCTRTHTQSHRERKREIDLTLPPLDGWTGDGPTDVQKSRQAGRRSGAVEARAEAANWKGSSK